MCSIFEIQQAIFKIDPDLEPKYEELTVEVREANRRLGNTLIAAYELADNGKLDEGILLLTNYEKTEPSDNHRLLAVVERERLEKNYRG